MDKLKITPSKETEEFQMKLAKSIELIVDVQNLQFKKMNKSLDDIKHRLDIIDDTLKGV